MHFQFLHAIISLPRQHEIFRGLKHSILKMSCAPILQKVVENPDLTPIKNRSEFREAADGIFAFDDFVYFFSVYAEKKRVIVFLIYVVPTPIAESEPAESLIFIRLNDDQRTRQLVAFVVECSCRVSVCRGLVNFVEKNCFFIKTFQMFDDEFSFLVAFYNRAVEKIGGENQSRRVVDQINANRIRLFPVTRTNIFAQLSRLVAQI